MENSVFDAFKSAKENRELIQILAKREVDARYRGALMGKVWLFIYPLIMLAIYTLVFQFIFRARWEGAPDTDFAYAQLLFIGMIVHSFASEVISHSPALIVHNPSYVKKVTFPLDIMPWVTVQSALVHALFSFAVLAVFLVLSNISAAFTWLFLPLILFPFCLFLLGVSWIISALGVYFRDLDQLTTLFVTALLFLSPVFYSVDSAPGPLRPIIALNPLSLIIEQSREVLIYQQLPNFSALGLYYCFALAVFAFGYKVFSKLRRGFADVL